MKQLEAWCWTKCPAAPSSHSSSLLCGHEWVQTGWLSNSGVCRLSCWNVKQTARHKEGNDFG